GEGPGQPDRATPCDRGQQGLEDHRPGSETQAKSPLTRPLARSNRLETARGSGRWPGRVHLPTAPPALLSLDGSGPVAGRADARGNGIACSKTDSRGVDRDPEAA